MPKKILLAGGDSFTDPIYVSTDRNLHPSLRRGWPMWPQLLGKELDLIVINTADSGRGNDNIAKRLLDQIYEYEDRIDTCVVLWSSIDRHDFHDKKKNVMNIPHDLLSVCGKKTYDFHNDSIEGNILAPVYAKLMVEEGKNTFWETLLNESFRNMWLVAEACNKYNITFIFRQGISLLDYHMWREIYDQGLISDDYKIEEADYYVMCDTNKYAKMLNKNYKKNITWPFWEYSTSIVSFTDELENLIISENDRHPSAAGQQYIADTFLTHYKTM
jgi:hypothetical protein